MARYNMDTVSVEKWVIKFDDANISAQGTWVPRLVKVGPIVYADGIVTRAGGFAANTTYDGVCTVPEQFRPFQTYYSPALAGATAASLATLQTHTSTGNLLIKTIAAASYISLSGVWWVADDTPVYNSNAALEG